MEHKANDGAGTGGGADSDGNGDSSDPSHLSDPSNSSPWGDVVGLAFTVLCAVLVLLPVLRPGVSLGPFDLLTRFGLTRQPGATVHNAIQADQIQQFVPWTDLAWHQIRSGHLPLWNPYSGLGTPLAFNWQSGIFSLPMLIGYLVPLHSAYAVAVLVKLIVAGTGAYTLCRVLKLGPLSSTLGGVTFELCGPIIVHSGWPMVGVTCWTGWLLAGVVRALQGRHRLGTITVLAVAVAFAVYGGHPESLAIVTLSAAVFTLVYVGVAARATKAVPWRGVMDVAIAALCGLALSAPLLFPGLQLGVSSARKNAIGAPAFSLVHVPNLLAGGLQGTDFTNSAYVGVIVLMLAAVGTKLYWHRPEVPALVVVAAGCALLTFFGPLDQLLHQLPGARTIAWSRSVMVLPLALAVLAAFGAEALVTSMEKETIVRWATWTLAAGAAVVAGVVLAAVLGLTPVAQHQLGSLVWPVVELVLGTGAVAALKWPDTIAPRLPVALRSSTRYIVVALLGANTAFLILSGVSFWSESSTYFSPTPAVAALKATVGTSVVGFGSCKHLSYLTYSDQEVGIRPEDNIGYGIREMVVYDPIIPDAYFQSWKAISGQSSPAALSGLGIFCARIDTVSQAQILGVSDVLEPPGKTGPVGSDFVRMIGGEGLYSIPNAGDATLTPAPADGAELPIGAVGTTVPVTHPNLESWRVTTSAPSPQVLRFRLTNVPGWNATMDGHSLTLHPWAHGLMLEARIPPGRHVIELDYMPAAFTDGVAVAAVTAAALVLTWAYVGLRARRRRGAKVSP